MRKALNVHLSLENNTGRWFLFFAVLGLWCWSGMASPVSLSHELFKICRRRSRRGYTEVGALCTRYVLCTRIYTIVCQVNGSGAYIIPKTCTCFFSIPFTFLSCSCSFPAATQILGRTFMVLPPIWAIKLIWREAKKNNLGTKRPNKTQRCVQAPNILRVSA